jgi:hypothetical protein
MARWLAHLCVVLLCVLAVHGVVLWGISQELQAMNSVIQVTPDPMFTRLITQQGSPAAANASIPAPIIAKPTGKTALKPPPTSGASRSLPVTTSTVQQTTPTLTTAPLTDTSTVTASTVVASATSSQTPTSTDTVATITSTTTTSSNAAGTGSADAAAALAQIGQWPSDTRLSYQLGGYFRGQLYGNAQVQWTRLPSLASTPGAGTDTAMSDRYQVRVNISIGGLANPQFTSQGRIRADGLLPEVYEEQLPNGQRSVKLDASGVVMQNGSRLPRPPLEPDAVQDTASQFVDIGHRFAQGRARLVAGETLRIWLARPGGLDEWVYDIGPAETLYLPQLGAVQAHHLKPRPLAKARGTITAEMWIAPSLQYLPVRVRVNLNSETHVDLLVKTIEQR